MAAPAARLAEIVEALGSTLQGSPDQRIERLAALDNADAAALSFVGSARYLDAARASAAGALLVPPALAAELPGRTLLLSAHPHADFARLTQWWVARQPRPAPSVHPSAVVDPSARIGPGVRIGPLAVVEADVVLGEGVEIGAQTLVEAGAQIGAGTRLYPQVVFGHHCRIGARGRVHAGTVIGADGFGHAQQDGRWLTIEQLGAVRLGDDVRIGANCTIDRGALGDTVLSDGVKLDNLIHIAHNVHIGAHTAMAGCSAVAGSARIGAHCTIGGDAKILGHLELADGVHISACSVVTRSLKTPGHYTGFFPIDDNAAWEKNAASLRSLHKLRERVRQLEKNQT